MCWVREMRRARCSHRRRFGIRALTVWKSFYRFAGFRKTRKNKKIQEKKAFHFLYFFLFSFVFSCFFQAAEGVILIPNSRSHRESMTIKVKALCAFFLFSIRKVCKSLVSVNMRMRFCEYERLFFFLIVKFAA